MKKSMNQEKIFLILNHMDCECENNIKQGHLETLDKRIENRKQNECYELDKVNQR